MKIVQDLSNYDADHDASNPNWAADFLAAGSEGIIVGSQWPFKARRQLADARAAGLPIMGTYAEPDVIVAVALALEFGVRYVGLACEPGGITSPYELRAAVTAVKVADLVPLIYANAGDYAAIAGPEFDGELRWLANYGANDPTHPKPPIEGVAVHQYSSSIVVAGRARDHNYWMIQEDDLTQAEKDELKALRVIVGGPAADGHDLLASINNLNASLTDHLANHGGAGAAGGAIAPHKHTGGETGDVK